MKWEPKKIYHLRTFYNYRVFNTIDTKRTCIASKRFVPKYFFYYQYARYCLTFILYRSRGIISPSFENIALQCMLALKLMNEVEKLDFLSLLGKIFVLQLINLCYNTKKDQSFVLGSWIVSNNVRIKKWYILQFFKSSASVMI